MTFGLSIAFNNGARHYRVKTSMEGGGARYHMAKGRFSSIPELIAWFQRKYSLLWRCPAPQIIACFLEHPENICCKLTVPVPKHEPDRIELPADVQKNWREIPRTQIQIVGDVLGKGNFGFVRKGKYFWSCRDVSCVVRERSARILFQESGSQLGTSRWKSLSKVSDRVVLPFVCAFVNVIF